MRIDGTDLPRKRSHRKWPVPCPDDLQLVSLQQGQEGPDNWPCRQLRQRGGVGPVHANQMFPGHQGQSINYALLSMGHGLLLQPHAIHQSQESLQGGAPQRGPQEIQKPQDQLRPPPKSLLCLPVTTTVAVAGPEKSKRSLGLLTCPARGGRRDPPRQMLIVQVAAHLLRLHRTAHKAYLGLSFATLTLPLPPSPPSLAPLAPLSPPRAPLSPLPSPLATTSSTSLSRTTSSTSLSSRASGSTSLSSRAFRLRSASTSSVDL